MKIVTYRELQPKDEIMMLMELAFWWPICPPDMEERIRTDTRLKTGPVGFCAVKDDRLAGFVGVMNLPTKTIENETETVGGIWGVATNPEFAKQGICKILLEEAHNYFQAQRYRFSFLCTGRTIIAYDIYKKLGYAEVQAINQFPGVYKVFSETESVFKTTSTLLDSEKIYHIYEEFMKDKTGFAIRQKDFVKMFAHRRRFDPAKSIQKEKGYALLSERQNVILVQDLVALDDLTCEELVDQIEQIARGGVIDRLVADQKLLGIYEAKGYKVQKRDDSVLMVKKLTDAEIEEVYGKSLYISALDWF